jgi:hypothetical protein
MRDPLDALVNAFERDSGGIALIWSPPDVGLRDWLVAEVMRLAASRLPTLVTTVEEALALPNQMVLLVPRNEREVVLDLDGSRERIFSYEEPRTQPIVLFLFRDGEGQRTLSEAASLRSLSRGSDPDPEQLAEVPRQVDTESERARFVESTGKVPESWLQEWQAERLARNAQNYYFAIWADFLVQ